MRICARSVEGYGDQYTRRGDTRQNYRKSTMAKATLTRRQNWRIQTIQDAAVRAGRAC